MTQREGGEASEALATARAFMAQRMLAPLDNEATLGPVTLRSHQRRALARVHGLLARHGGALLADEAGMGKTYVALAVARRHRQVLIVAPASLREHWESSLRQTMVRAELVSFERLSRAATLGKAVPVDLVIVDEAHHLRNRDTRRYRAVAALCDRARVLLVSATPLHNRCSDLAAQLALFLGDSPSAMTEEELARFVVRHETAHAEPLLPAVDGPHWIRLSHDDELLDALVALPPSVPGADEGHGGALVVYTLLRQWASSRAALVEALRRRIARALAMRSALECGRWPARRELAAWLYADGALQLAFPELLAPAGGDAASFRELLAVVAAHEQALRELLALVRARADPDAERADALRQIRARHAGARVIAFSQYAETVRAIARRLLADGGVAELTARSARIASGTLPRAEVLAQLAPGADGARSVDRIDMLVTTDVLSEGLDLHGASVVVHLDLPWNPARLEQRVGRVRRIGSAFPVVFTYALAPPASSERMLRVENRLRRKLRLSGRVVGRGLDILPRDGSLVPRGAAELAGETLAALERWLRPSRLETTSCHATASTPLAAAVESEYHGFLALVDDDETFLVADVGDGPCRDPGVVGAAVRSLENTAAPAPSVEVSVATTTLNEWLRRRRGHRAIGLHSSSGARIRRRISGHIAELLARTARHERVRLTALASRARHALRVPLSVAGEHALAALSVAAAVDERWLAEVEAIGDGRGSRNATSGAPEEAARSAPWCEAPSPERSDYSVLVVVLLRHGESLGA